YGAWLAICVRMPDEFSSCWWRAAVFCYFPLPGLRLSLLPAQVWQAFCCFAPSALMRMRYRIIYTTSRTTVAPVQSGYSPFLFCCSPYHLSHADFLLTPLRLLMHFIVQVHWYSVVGMWCYHCCRQRWYPRAGYVRTLCSPATVLHRQCRVPCLPLRLFLALR